MTVPAPAVIRAETPADAASVRDVVGRAFHRQPAVVDLVELIRASPNYVPNLALVAVADDAIVGFVMLSHAELVDTQLVDAQLVDTQLVGTELVDTASARHDVLTLSPLAVAPAYERRGIGSALVRAGLAAADATGAGLVTLEGSPDFYGRLGFTFAPDSGVTIDLPDWAASTAAQVYRLSSYDPSVRGRLVYPPAFAAIE